MGLALTGARWTVKPPPGTDLDRAHALCPDHAWPFLAPQGTAQSLAKAAPLLAPSTRGDIYTGSSSMVSTRAGLAVRHGATSDTTRLTADLAAEVDKVIPLSGGHTVLLIYKKTDATIRGVSAFGINTSTGNEWYGVHGLPYSDGNAYWRYGQLTEGVGQLTVTAATLTTAGVNFQQDSVWVFTAGPRGMEMFNGGRLLGSNSGTSSRTSAGAKPLLFPAFTPVNSDLCDIALVMTWRRQLAAAAIRALSINPWQVFQPPTLVVLRWPPAPPAPVFPPGAYQPAVIGPAT